MGGKKREDLGVETVWEVEISHSDFECVFRPSSLDAPISP